MEEESREEESREEEGVMIEFDRDGSEAVLKVCSGCRVVYTVRHSSADTRYSKLL